MIDDPREEILSKYDGLIHQYAHRYAHPNVPVEDLAQEGRLGLLRGVERYGTESMAYVHGSISSGMIDHIRQTTHKGNAVETTTLEWCDLPYNDKTDQVDNNIVISEALQVLHDKERMVILAYLHDIRDEKLGRYMGYTCNDKKGCPRVSQLRKQAIEKMRRYYEA